MNSYKILTLSGHSPEFKQYENMVYSDFLESLRYGNDWFKMIDQDNYYQSYHQVIHGLLSRGDSTVRLAVFTDEPDTCLGWSLSSSSLLHYVYVKKDARKKGIGRELLPKGFDHITHLTTVGVIIWRQKLPTIKFNPFL